MPGPKPASSAPGPGRTRFRVWRAGRGVKPAQFIHELDPRSIGSPRAGRQLYDGKLRLGGTRVELELGTIWDPDLDHPADEAARHGFAWLDDLAAEGTRRTADLARIWLVEWLERFGAGQGPGWSAEITGRRLLRLIHNSALLEEGLEPKEIDAFRRSLSLHLRYLERHWAEAPPGLPRFEALCGLIIAGAAIEGGLARVRPGVKRLESLCRDHVGPEGELAARNPEALLDLFALLVWTEMALADCDLPAQPEHRAAIQRMGPVLRHLRQADGGLPRFHGGARGSEGRLDSLLAASKVRLRLPETALAMGFARLARGRVSLLLDAAAPPDQSPTAHAATLAFEMTVDRRPLVVNCGPGDSFSRRWDQASRGTPAHSTLAPDGVSSAQFVPAANGPPLLVQGPGDVQYAPAPERGPASLSAAHDGFVASHGLVHLRKLDLAADGAALSGEDLLTAPTLAGQARLRQLVEALGGQGVGFTVRFHLHPEVTARLSPGGDVVELMLKSGELWLFSHEGPARITLDPSVYLEKTRAEPTPTRQIVLEASAQAQTTALRWRFERAQARTAPDPAGPAF